MTSESAAKKNIQKLQRAIIDGLEDVKAQNIEVFNTEHLSPLFERVVVASGTSNRQTKALAASVRDAVREAGFDKPRTEGEENGEWIIVDCGPAVVHVMQPAIRQYYRLEDIWGDKPVRLKHAAQAKVDAKADVRSAAPAGRSAPAGGKPAAKASTARPTSRSTGRTAAKPAAKTPATQAAAGARASAKSAARRTVVAAKTPARKSTAAVAVVKVGAPAARKAPVKTATQPTARTPARKTATKPATKTASRAKPKA